MSNDAALRPFRIEIPQADLDDVKTRLARIRWPRTRARTETSGMADSLQRR
jgi:hypothetical protein